MRKIITPSEASHMLKQNKMNRPLKIGPIQFLKKEIESGRFVYNGQAICFTEDGELLNGQHRLTACVESDIPIDVEVLYGIPKSAFITMDTGTPRSSGDIFHINNITNSRTKASITGLIVNKVGLGKRSVGRASMKYSNEFILEYYINNSSAIDDCYYTIDMCYRKNKILPRNFASAMAFLLSPEPHKDGIAFIRQIYTGVKETESNIPILIRERLIKDQFSKTSTLATDKKRNMIINGFRSYSQGKTWSRLASHVFDKTSF